MMDFYNGEIPAEFQMGDQLKKFQEEIAGHLRREWAYRNFIRETLDRMQLFLGDRLLAELETEFERLQKL